MIPNLEAWIKEAWERCEKATPGPWSYWRDARGTEGDAAILQELSKYTVPVFVEHPFNRLDDGDFVAHARTDLPLALEMLEKALTALKEIRNEPNMSPEGPVPSATFLRAVATAALESLEAKCPPK